MSIEGSVAVRDLLPLLRAWRPQVIAGAGGLGRAVTWANTMRPRLPAFEGLRPGDLAILSLSALRSFNTQAPLTLSGAIEQLSEMGASAVVVIGLSAANQAENRRTNALNGTGAPSEGRKLVALDDLRRHADGHALPVVALAAEVSPSEVERAVIAYVVEHRQHSATDALRASLRNETLDALLTGAYVGEAQMRARAAQLGFDLAQQYIALWVELVEPVEGGSAPRRASIGTGHAEQLAETLGVALGAWARVRQRAQMVGARSDGEGDSQPPREHEERARAIGQGAHEIAWLAAIHASGRDLQLASRKHPAGAVTPAQVVALLPLAHGASTMPHTELSEGSAYASLSERITTLLTRTLGKVTGKGVGDAPAALWIAGLGAPASAPAQARRSVEEARDAARLGGVVFGPGRVTKPADLGVYRLLLALRQTGELEAFVRQTLAPLQAESRSGEALIETLEAFVACNGNLSEAARRLGLHRNSLLYRLGRARELLGHDLDDPELRLALQLAIKSQHVLRLLDW